jgi:hypothetical protein
VYRCIILYHSINCSPLNWPWCLQSCLLRLERRASRNSRARGCTVYSDFSPLPNYTSVRFVSPPMHVFVAFAAKHSNLSLMTCQSLLCSHWCHGIPTATSIQHTSLYPPHPADFNTSLDSSVQTGLPSVPLVHVRCPLNLGSRVGHSGVSVSISAAHAAPYQTLLALRVQLLCISMAANTPYKGSLPC